MPTHNLTVKHVCTDCQGSGVAIKALGIRCHRCWGAGMTIPRHCPNCLVDYQLFIPQPCPTCGRDFNEDELG